MHEIFSEDAMANETNLKDLLKDPSLLATQGYLAGEWVESVKELAMRKLTVVVLVLLGMLWMAVPADAGSIQLTPSKAHSSSDRCGVNRAGEP